MPVESEYQLFDFNPIGLGLRNAIEAGVSSPAQPVQVAYNNPTQETSTPIVRVQFISGAVRNNSRITVPNVRAELQPRNAYDFTLTATIETQRELNGVLHAELVAKTRLALQLYKLALTPESWWLYHTVRDILELSAMQLATDDTATTDSTILTFTGWFDIAPRDWPVVRPEPPINVLVSGAGTTNANGTYAPNGTTGGRTRYEKSGGAIFWSGFEVSWFIFLDDSAVYYAPAQDVEFPWLVSTWESGGGDLPVPTVSQI